MINIYFVLFCIFYLSLMRTECPNNCDGQDACNETTKECLVGCVKGKYGTICDHDCPSTCQECSRDNGSCTLNASVTESDCPDGFHGQQCTLTCPTSCQSVCDRSTGNCSAGCKAGYGGEFCDKKCSHCAGDGSCSQTDLRCLSGCAAGFKGKICSLTMSSNVEEDDMFGMFMIAAIFFIGLCISLSSFALRFRIRNLSPSTNEE